MAGQAEIGALHVTLGMDSATFEAAAKRVKGSLDGLATKFGIAAAAGTAAGQLLANSVTASMRGISQGFTGAINRVGDLADASQKFGVSAEHLMGLSHAADLSGTSMEGLAKGMQKLAVNMTAIAGGDTGGKAADTLKALGLSAVDATGNLKGTDALMIQLADKFAGMQDGAAKTAMAVALFGKAGAELIPMLNLGSKELQKLSDEANQLGLVLDNETAKGLEALGDQWQSIGKWMQGFYTQLASELLPTLKFLTDRIWEWLNTGGGVKQWAQWAADGIKSVVAYGYEASAAFARLRENVAAAGTAFANFFSGNWSKIAEDNAASAERLKGIEQQLTEDLKSIWAERLAIETANETFRQQTLIPMRSEGHRKLTEGEKELNRLLEEGKRLTEESLPPLEKLAATQEKLDILFAQGAISAETYGRAMQKATLVASNAYASAASSIAGDLGKVFENNKAVAIATALINTYQSITNAWANVPWPLNIAAAAAAAAAGFAQVANIRSTTKSGGGGGNSGSGGGSSAAAPAAEPQQQQSLYLNLVGSRFSRDEVIGLIDDLNAAQRDGHKILVMT